MRYYILFTFNLLFVITVFSQNGERICCGLFDEYSNCFIQPSDSNDVITGLKQRHRPYKSAEHWKVTIAGGIGFPDLANISVRLNFGQKQLGISGGYLPDWRGDWYSLSVDYFKHFGGYSRL